VSNQGTCALSARIASQPGTCIPCLCCTLAQSQPANILYVSSASLQPFLACVCTHSVSALAITCVTLVADCRWACSSRPAMRTGPGQWPPSGHVPRACLCPPHSPLQPPQQQQPRQQQQQAVLLVVVGRGGRCGSWRGLYLAWTLPTTP
jgi:hypothetical protein